MQEGIWLTAFWVWENKANKCVRVRVQASCAALKPLLKLITQVDSGALVLALMFNMSPIVTMEQLQIPSYSAS